MYTLRCINGTTSAYAENTTVSAAQRPSPGNYLRVRGEYTIVNTHECKVLELPPRTRRIHDPGFAVGASPGTTSAYAENTLISKKAQVSVRNYLRVRGEYPTTRFRRRGRKELPPRTRRIPHDTVQKTRKEGTTSAYAENTVPNAADVKNAGNYLRVRGEYQKCMARGKLFPELPPRTRRIPAPINSRHCSRGTTSAYAENTGSGLRWWRAPGNYLRVRGEYSMLTQLGREHTELPPRTRRIRGSKGVRGRRGGTTSAYAENTDDFAAAAVKNGNYLRVRGEYAFFGEVCAPVVELPPRTRRILDCLRAVSKGRGTTSAYAENTRRAEANWQRLGNYLRVRGEYCMSAFAL